MAAAPLERARWWSRAHSVSLARLAARDWGPELNAMASDALVPEVPSPDDIMVLVSGGVGKHSAALPSFGPTVSVTRRIPGD